ncbi:MAG TPA: hypothetical protein VGM74_04890, partial [Burkholderiaceae bacterium]
TRLGQSVAPIGTPRPIASVPLPGITVDGAVGQSPAASAPSAADAAASAASSPQQQVALAARPK